MQSEDKMLLAGLLVFVGLLAVAFLWPGVARAAVASSTAYAPCSSGGVMADGTPTTGPNRDLKKLRRAVAMNGVRLGTKIKIIGPQPGPGGRRLFVVRDRIGHSSQLDFWVATCPEAWAWGRRNVTWKIGW